jgi:ribosomal protein S18 acetylase RimI-like enzyme
MQIRKAHLNDIEFLVETIVEAEKSGSKTFTYHTIFDLDEAESKRYIRRMLEEEVDGCELSVSSFYVAVQNGVLIGAVSAWIEGLMGSSSILKGNLLQVTLPKTCFKSIASLGAMLNELHFDYKNNTIQLGLVYLTAEARGKGLVKDLIHYAVADLKKSNPKIQCDDVYVQVFGGNIPAIKAYEKVGFAVVDSKKSAYKNIEQYLPSNSKLLMKLKLNR